MKNNQIIQNAQEIVADLRVWATDYGHAKDPYVIALGDALEKGQQLDYWASVDPLEYLPTNDTVNTVPELRIARLLAAIRNVIIFLPVAITWAAVAEATKGFTAFTQANNNGTPANFLLFWQNGFGYLSDFWKIGNIAQIDFLIVVVVIVFSALVSYIQSRGLRRATILQAMFSRQRRLLGLRVKSYLFAYREVKSVDLPADLVSSVQLLRQATVDALSNLQALQKSAAHLSEYVPSLIDLGAKMVSSADTAESSIKAILEESTASVSQVLADIEVTSTSIKSNSRSLQDQMESLQRTLNRKK